MCCRIESGRSEGSDRHQPDASESAAPVWSRGDSHGSRFDHGVFACPGEPAASSRRRLDRGSEIPGWVGSAGTLRTVTAIAALASAACIVLLLVNVAMMRPSMTGQANPQNAREGVVPLQTLTSSVETLKGRASEMQRMRDVEKARADELAGVTATLVRSLSSGFISIAENGEVIDMNASAYDLLGVVRPIDSLHKGVLEILGHSRFAETSTTRFGEGAASTCRDRGSGRNDLRVRTTVPLVDEQGKHLGMFALFTDLGPIRRLQSRVRELQSLADLGEISAGIAHEFRNSLSTILGYLRLAGRTNPSAEVMEKLRHAEREATGLSDAVERLLSFARPFTLQLVAVDLKALIVQVGERLASTADGAVIDIDGEDAVLQGDPALLERAFDNLIRNAIDSVHQKSPGAGRVEIRVSTKPMRVEIADDGVGVDPADVPRLLMPFQSNKPSGFGLGLPLARKIVLLHGGSLSLTGTPSVGARVVVTFGDPE